MDENKKCDGHCQTCDINQRTYCAAQMAYYNQKEIAEIKAYLERKEDNSVSTLIGKENATEGSKIAEIETETV